MRFAKLAVLLLLVTSAVHADDRRYAVLSLAADKLLIAQYNLTTGSRLDRNARQFVPLADDSLDRAILRSVDQAVRRFAPGAKPELLATADPALRALADAGMESRNVDALIPLVRAQVPAGSATHLILVTKHRAEGRTRFASSTGGTGAFEGLGFYIDRVKRVRNTRTGEVTTGYIAPFAYLRFTLVDLGTGTVVKTREETLSTVTASQAADTPWEALTGAQKVGFLQSLARQAAGEAIPELLAP